MIPSARAALEPSTRLLRTLLLAAAIAAPGEALAQAQRSGRAPSHEVESALVASVGRLGSVRVERVTPVAGRAGVVMVDLALASNVPCALVARLASGARDAVRVRVGGAPPVMVGTGLEPVVVLSGMRAGVQRVRLEVTGATNAAELPIELALPFERPGTSVATLD